MVDEAKELPTTEEPKETEAKVETDVDGLMTELEKAGVTNTEELQGKLKASGEAGTAFRMLGDERKKSQELQEKLDTIQTRPQQPQQDYMDYPEGQSVDIESAIEKGVNKVLNRRDEVAKQAQEKSMAAWTYIQNDEDYLLVKDIWEEKLKDPGYVYQIQSGMIDPVNEYTSTLRKYYKTLLKKSHETITTMQGGKVDPPHVETGERVPANIVSEGKDVSAHRKLLDAMHKKIATGYVPTNEEEALIAEATLIAGHGN